MSFKIKWNQEDMLWALQYGVVPETSYFNGAPMIKIWGLTEFLVKLKVIKYDPT